MLYIIFGQDSFRIKEKLSQIKEKFKVKTGSDLNIENYDETISIEQIRNILQFSGFFNPYKLIIFKNFINKASPEVQKELLKFLRNLDKKIYIVFLEDKERKNPIWKIAAKNGKIWQLEPLRIYELNIWIRNRIEAKGGKVESEAIKTLAFYIGNDLWRMENEINKLIIYKRRKIISKEDVEELVKPDLSPKIFDLIDHLGARKLKLTQQTLRNLFLAGENPLYIHAMIVYQFRNLIMVKYLFEKGARQAEICEQTGLHPFVIQKSLAQVKNFSFEQFKKIYAKLLDAEIAMKTGKIEPDLALELLVAGLIG